MKRGLSGIITVILIILISIIAISILWLFVQPAIVNTIGKDKDDGEFNRFAKCADLKLKAESCYYTEDSIEVEVSRGAGTGEINDLAFKFDEGTFKLDDGIGSIPGEFGTSKVTFSQNLFPILPSNVLVTAILPSGQACQFDDNPTICVGKPDSNSTCGNGILEDGEECDDGNLVNGDGCSDQCLIELQNQKCDHVYGVVYLEDFEDECTRVRNGALDPTIRPLPAIGFHSVGTDPTTIDRTADLGAEFQRLIIGWHQAYDEFGNLKLDGLEAAISAYKTRDMKMLLTLKANHPEKSTCTFDISGISLEEKDSYPKNEQEWKDYIKLIVDRYYVQEVNAGNEPTLVAIQLGNEWSHQFKVSTDPISDPYCNNPVSNDIVIGSMVDLTALTKQAMDEAMLNLNPGEKRLPLVTFGITGGDAFALKRGYNTHGYIYTGAFSNGIERKEAADITLESVQYAEKFIVDAAPHYDYLDVHLRGDYFEDYGFLSQWIRDLWNDNNIVGKGISSTEYGGPWAIYTTDYQEYFITATLTHSFLQGYDAIAWASYFPTMKLNVQFGLEALLNYNQPQEPRWYAINGYTAFTTASKGFSKVELSGEDSYYFLDSNDNVIGYLNTSLGDLKTIGVPIPDIPSTPNQCEDGLDNDGDGLIDGEDDFCGVGSFATDVEFNESGIYF